MISGYLICSGQCFPTHPELHGAHALFFDRARAEKYLADILPKIRHNCAPTLAVHEVAVDAVRVDAEGGAD